MKVETLFSNPMNTPVQYRKTSDFLFRLFNPQNEKILTTCHSHVSKHSSIQNQSGINFSRTRSDSNVNNLNPKRLPHWQAPYNHSKASAAIQAELICTWWAEYSLKMKPEHRTQVLCWPRSWAPAIYRSPASTLMRVYNHKINPVREA